ncbi:TfuA-like protein [Streptomyces jumonjinensis]|nr:TfuA-like protein [Streptomyces jumonjinensis]
MDCPPPYGKWRPFAGVERRAGRYVAIHVFAGPTISGREVAELVPSAIVHGPVKHGDLFRAGIDRGDIALIIDGLYHSHPPVRHKEILDVIDRGTAVTGTASMGALRAAELHPWGMDGVGRVFEAYRDGRIDADDEVAVVHTADSEWRVLTDALVNIRHTLDLAVAAGLSDRATADRLLAVATGLHYTRRSWNAVIRQLREPGGQPADGRQWGGGGRWDDDRQWGGDRQCDGGGRWDGDRQCDGGGADAAVIRAAERIRLFREAEPERCDLKRQDAVTALRGLGATAASSPRTRHASGAWPSGWRTAYLRQWRRQFTGSLVDGRFVSHAARFDHARLYDPGFPARWREHVLRTAAGTAGDPHPTTEPAALDAAARQGLTYEQLTEEQLSSWLTDDEIAALPPAAAVLTIMVRSARPTVDLDDPRLRARLVGEDRGREISHCLAVNEKIAAGGHARHVDCLKPAVLCGHLTAVWGLGPDAGERQTTAAARDRGFASVAEAAEAARPFFLRWYATRRSTPKETP